jgi:hypothetical protein
MIPHKRFIVWGTILSMVPLISISKLVLMQTKSEPEFSPAEWMRWIGIGLIVFVFVKNGREPNY